MANLSVTELISFIPKALVAAEKGVETVKAITALTDKSAKNVAATLGIATDSALYLTADLVDSIIEAAKT